MARWLITGGAGFIGSNVALRLHEEGEDVVIVDDLSRPGSIGNAQMLAEAGIDALVEISVAHTSRFTDFAAQAGPFDVVLHLAAQVSLMESLRDPRGDFEANALGTLNLLESCRSHWPAARFLFASTNKVYGDLAHHEVREDPTRFVMPDAPNGIGEGEQLDFHGGYSCSKGAADQYVLDYHRVYALDTVVFRQSAICGRFQNPKADQGWASFLVQETMAGREVQLNGWGKQVRDLLDVDDLVALYLEVGTKASLRDRVFNVGGGVGRDISLLELFAELDRRGFRSRFTPGPLRPSDQMVFVADLERLFREVAWRPRYSLTEIIDRLVEFERSR